ncbi:hypothetical protein TNCV_1909071 [Trichonephila clavipes]|nr:hypothetical protein TNCV_1909071 [Trichonephila clavipes]
MGWGENIVEVKDKSHEEDNDESKALIEDLDKALDLEFESGRENQGPATGPPMSENSTITATEALEKRAWDALGRQLEHTTLLREPWPENRLADRVGLTSVIDTESR